MKYKLIAVDIDGTLLDSQRNLTERTKKAIQMAAAKGVVFTLCTGRPVQGVELYLNILNLDAPVITYNGAMIVTGKSKKILYEQNLMPRDARNVLDWGKRVNTTVIIWSDNKLYVFERNQSVEAYKRISGVEPILITDEEELMHNGITKILWYDREENIYHFQNFLLGKLGEGVTFCTSQPIFLEFFDSRVSKAAAMEKIGVLLGIDREEMAAVGDGYNDLSMIEYAGLGVAMGNAPDEIKKKADYVTLSNDNDGLAFFIEKFFK